LSIENRSTKKSAKNLKKITRDLAWNPKEPRPLIELKKQNNAKEMREERGKTTSTSLIGVNKHLLCSLSTYLFLVLEKKDEG